MATDAMVGKGVILARGNGDGPPETFTTVAEVIDFSGPDGQATVIDASHMQSTSRDKLMGLPDEGQMTLTANLIPSNAAQFGLQQDRAAQPPVLRNFEFTFTDSPASKIAFSAYVLQYAPAGTVDDKVTVNIVLEISGPVTWTPGA